jgi:acetyltransferase-like isoleucine patch superfamily enzyme
MKIGKYTYGYENIKTSSWGEGSILEIGSFCSIAEGVKIFLGGNHRTDWISTYPFGHIHKQIFNNFDGYGHPKTNGNVIIGNDVWIGENVTIMSGVLVGDGAVIAANSHIVKDVEPYTIVGGNPSNLIKYRFDKEIIQKLLELKWWDLNDDVINRLTPYLCSNNFEEVFKRVSYDK